MGDVEMFPEALDRVLALGWDEEAREVELALVLVVGIGVLVLVRHGDAPAVEPVGVSPRVVFDTGGCKGRHAVCVDSASASPPTLLAVFAAQRASTATVADARGGAGTRGGPAHDMRGAHSTGGCLGALKVERSSRRQARRATG